MLTIGKRDEDERGAAAGGSIPRAQAVQPRPGWAVPAATGTAARPAAAEGGERAEATGRAARTREGQVLPSVDVAALHLLIVDDEEALRHACGEIARGMGFLVQGAESVPAARAILRQQPIDLLLLDMKLPGAAACFCSRRPRRCIQRHWWW